MLVDHQLLEEEDVVLALNITVAKKIRRLLMLRKNYSTKKKVSQ